MKEELFEGFFSDGAEFWIGKVVDIEAQKTSAQGFSWGWRYKVRIFGTYSNSDNIEDKDCHTAMVMLGVTDGSGAANSTDATLGQVSINDDGSTVTIKTCFEDGCASGVVSIITVAIE